MKSTTTTASLNRKASLALVPVVLLFSACGGGGDSQTGSSNATPPILQVGMHREYAGTTTRSVVHVNPTSTAPDNTLAYTFTEVQDVLQAPANAPGAFDIRSVYTYTITQDPGTGTVPISQTVDDFRNLVVSGSTQSTLALAQTSTMRAMDESSNALGDGPYTQTTTTSTTYPTPRSSLSYPLQAGASITVPQSSTQNITYLDINPAGAPPSNGNNIGYSRSRSQADDGSFTFQQTGVTGVSETVTQNPDGSGSTSTTNSTGTTTTAVGLPVLVNGSYTIPINRVVTSTTPSSKTYSAVDWYPNGGVVSAPLTLQKQTVVGPVTTLPTQCSGALVQPNMVEVDSTTSNLNTINASSSVTTTRSFNANGVTVCTLTQQTTSAYNLLTGALTSTTTTQTTTLLKSM